MKIPPSGDKISGITDNLLSGSEAVKISTRSKPELTTVLASLVDSHAGAAGEKATSVKLGLAKYISEELDPSKVQEMRRAKIADLAARIQSGSYLESINSEKLAQKIIEEAQLETLIAEKAVSNE